MGPSGKSTQKAFMLRPYMKLAKLSLKRARDSCMSWKCIMLASRSAMASLSSAKAGSKAARGKAAALPSPPAPLDRADSRREEREEGRSGVVGRLRERERDREREREGLVGSRGIVVGVGLVLGWTGGCCGLGGWVGG